MSRRDKICGVYIIMSLIDSRMYVGSSVNIMARWKLHKNDLKTGRHHSRHLQNFVNKHGMESIAFCIVRDCETGVDPRREEQRYIDGLKPEFNVCPFARSCLGVKRTPESKERNRLAQLKRDLNGPRNPMYGTIGNKSPNWGKKHRPDTIAKMIANHMPCSGKDNPNYGKKQSVETTQKANETRRQNTIKKHGKICLFLNGHTVFEGATIPECASFIGVNPCSVRRAFNKGKPCKGYTIQKPQ